MKLPEELQFMANARLPQHRTQARLDGCVCVITGATSGVGLSAARRLAAGGAHLVMICRNADKGARVQAELRRRAALKQSSCSPTCAIWSRCAAPRRRSWRATSGWTC